MLNLLCCSDVAVKEELLNVRAEKVGKLFLIYQIGSTMTSAAYLTFYILEPLFGVRSSKYQNECRGLILFFIYSILGS